jgi:hypothetical protein
MDDRRPQWDERTVATIAATAEADERSVWKRLAGGEVRGRVQARIDRAIAEARAQMGGAETNTDDGPGTTARAPR